MAFYFEANDGRSGEAETTFAAMRVAVGSYEAQLLADDMETLQWRSCPEDDEFARCADAVGANGDTVGWFGELRR